MFSYLPFNSHNSLIHMDMIILPIWQVRQLKLKEWKCLAQGPILNYWTQVSWFHGQALSMAPGCLIEALHWQHPKGAADKGIPLLDCLLKLSIIWYTSRASISTYQEGSVITSRPSKEYIGTCVLNWPPWPEKIESQLSKSTWPYGDEMPC